MKSKMFIFTTFLIMSQYCFSEENIWDQLKTKAAEIKAKTEEQAEKARKKAHAFKDYLFDIADEITQKSAHDIESYILDHVKQTKTYDDSIKNPNDQLLWLQLKEYQLRKYQFFALYHVTCGNKTFKAWIAGN